ncbi:gp53-like domain-containing protein [Enterobacter roggenkampii]|uniref:gp53-like domain-containing protein n=2 Tax=Enterobacter roggenkampii TaxID=1812935 RepID=UPI00207509EB|nr:hypothetical protein [Enterobacter roggenkampii]MCM7724408.1 hypothetical protein [Enterobacter roggenkampii]
MLRIGQVEATATQDGKYTDGSVAGGIAATRLRAAAFNAMQEELAHIVESAGLALDINDMTQVLKAIQKLTLSRINPFADIKSDGAAAISTALANLGLKEAAKRDVGTGANQIPDMSSFLSSTGDTGFQRFPGGLILQWGFTNPSPNNTKNTVAFPIAYSTRCNGVILQYVNSGIVDNPAQGTPHQIGVYTRLGFDFYYTGSATGMQHFWFSWGY